MIHTRKFNMAEDKKFTTDGIVLRGPASFGSNGLINDEQSYGIANAF